MNPDGSANTTGNNAAIFYTSPMAMHFDLIQTQVSFDMLDWINDNGTSTPGTLKLGGTVVDSFTLTTANETINFGTVGQLDGRFDLSLAGGFDEIDLGLTGPSDGGITIDNVNFSGNPVPEPASLSVLGIGVLGLLARRRKA